MSISTRTGDDGTTALVFNRRVSKADARIEAYGTVDELTSAIGMARSGTDGEINARLRSIQEMLISVMSELATLPEDAEMASVRGRRPVSAAQVEPIEKWIAELEQDRAGFSGWAIPGDTRVGADFDFARAVCRRTERHLVSLSETSSVNPEIIRILNRLSDLLWLLARIS